MLDTLQHRAPDEYRRRLIAASMSLLGAFQQDLRYVEQVESRLCKIYEPFSSGVILPRLGLTVAEIVRGFRLLREIVADQIEAVSKLRRRQ